MWAVLIGLEKWMELNLTLVYWPIKHKARGPQGQPKNGQLAQKHQYPHLFFISSFAQLRLKPFFFSNVSENCVSIYIKKKKEVKSSYNIKNYRIEGSVTLTHPENTLSCLCYKIETPLATLCLQSSSMDTMASPRVEVLTSECRSEYLAKISPSLGLFSDLKTLHIRNWSILFAQIP